MQGDTHSQPCSRHPRSAGAFRACSARSFCRSASDFACDDPKASLSIVMQSPANYWMNLGSVPVALLYSFFMDYFVSGLTAGALKG